MNQAFNEAAFRGQLAHFTGAQEWFRHALVPRIVFTDGAQFVAEQLGAYWLLDEVAIAQIAKPAVRAEDFQVWKLTVTDGRGMLACEDGNGNRVFRKRIPFTDCPVPEVVLWYVGGTIMLPSEY